MSPPMRRPLDLGERYFRLLGSCSSMTLVCGAELGRRVGVDDVAAAWRAVGASVALPGLRIDDEAGDLVWSAPRAGPGSSDLDLRAAARVELGTRFGAAEPMARLTLADDGAGTVLLLSAHHAVADARALLGVLRALVGLLDAGATLGGAEPEVPEGLLERTRPGLRWPADRREVLPLLREVVGRRRAEGDAATYPHHPRPRHADPDLDLLVERLDPDRASALRDRARAMGSTVTGVLAAAALLASRDVLIPSGDRLALTVPVDLRPRLAPPAPLDAPGVAVSLLGVAPAVVEGDGSSGLPALAAEVSGRVAAAVADGEGELFYALTAPDRMPLDDRGRQRTAEALAAADDAIAVSNVGVLAGDGVGTSSAVRCWFALPPTPNQVCFLAATTSGAGLTLTSTSARLNPATHRSWIDGLLERLPLPG